MELNLTRQTIAINEVVYDGSVEQAVECDILLPDYCPDIVKILKCAVDTAVTSSVVSGDKLAIEGVSMVHIYYMAENTSIRHTEYKAPFGKTVELRGTPDRPAVIINSTLDYVNCRAISQRRIDVRGAVTMDIKIIDQRENQIISGGEGIEMRQSMISSTKITGVNAQRFSMEDDLEIGYGKATVANVIRYDQRADLMDSKVIAGKVVVKGELTLHILYQPEEDDMGLEVMEYALPISQIIDCDGVDENAVCDVDLSVLSCDIAPKLDAEGEYRLFSLNAELAVGVKAHLNVETPVADDCYSILYESRFQSQSIGFIQLVDMVRDTYTHKETVDLTPDVAAVLDIWSQLGQSRWEAFEDGISLSARVNICAFVRLDNGEVNYLEFPADTTHKIALSKTAESILFSPSLSVGATSYSLSGSGKIDIRCEIRVSGCIYNSFQMNSISNIQLDMESPKANNSNKLYIYYADAGERIWDIAKRYNTSVGAVMAENGIESDLLDNKRMLLIPIVYMPEA